MSSERNSIAAALALARTIWGAVALFVLSITTAHSQATPSVEAWCKTYNSDPTAINRCIASARQDGRSSEWWCEASRAYFPTVTTCAAGWRAVNRSPSLETQPIPLPAVSPSTNTGQPAPITPRPPQATVGNSRGSSFTLQAPAPAVTSAVRPSIPTTVTDTDVAHSGLILALGVGFIVVLAILTAVAMYAKRERAFKAAKTTIIGAIKQHMPTLARKRAQLVRDDGYGKLIYDKWIKQIDYFVNEHIMPLLKSEERNIIAQKGFNIGQAVFLLVEQQKNEDPAFQAFSDDMTPNEFEAFCAEELRRGGWNARKTMQSRDQGVDVVAEKDGTRVVVQCKLYSRPVGNKAVQEVAAARAHERADFGIVVSNHRYTQDAEELASTNKILLLHYTDLQNLDSFIHTGSAICDDWYYYHDGDEVGPLTLERLRATLAAFQNARDVLVWCERFENWKRAKNVPELRMSQVYAPQRG
jgi:hypothetical protein